MFELKQYCTRGLHNPGDRIQEQAQTDTLLSYFRCYNQASEMPMTFDPSSLGNVFLVLSAWGGAFLAALWLSLIIWTYRDIRSRARDPLARILSVLVVAVLTLPGIVIYLILRPQRTLEEEYQHTLEEEALLHAIEDASLCPGCGRRVKDPWMVCPSCHTKLKKKCRQCGELMELPWNICPYCGTPAPGMRREGMTLEESLRNLAPASAMTEQALITEDDDHQEAVEDAPQSSVPTTAATQLGLETNPPDKEEKVDKDE